MKHFNTVFTQWRFRKSRSFLRDYLDNRFFRRLIRLHNDFVYRFDFLVDCSLYEPNRAIWKRLYKYTKLVLLCIYSFIFVFGSLGEKFIKKENIGGNSCVIVWRRSNIWWSKWFQQNDLLLANSLYASQKWPILTTNQR